jgi:hypothetical protein
VLFLALASPAAAQVPIPETPGSDVPAFVGEPAERRPVFAVDPPRHPFMAPNGDSNLHVDAYQTDVHQQVGPLGRDMQRVSSVLEGVCASVTFDSAGRIVTVCVGVEGPRLVLVDPVTLRPLAVMPLPPRRPGLGGSIFNDFAGGGYFYLDNRDRAVIPTTDLRLLVVRVSRSFSVERAYDLRGAVAPDDKIVSALPDWAGRIWFVSAAGVVGAVDPVGGAVRPLALGEAVANSFAVDETGGVYVITQRALYRLDAANYGAPRVTWREAYENSGVSKPGQVHAGSGTTPTLLGREFVAIADNADPMNVVVYRRGVGSSGPREVCRVPVFSRGASGTDQSLIGAGRSLIVENNYGYTGPTSTTGGATTVAGLERVDLRRDGRGCRHVWHSSETAPSVVPKLSAGSGLVYTYTKDRRADGQDPWFLTALDFRTRRTVWKRLAGEGFGFNNNYAPVTIGPEGTAYVGVLGGLVALRDRMPPSGVPPAAPALSVRVRGRRVRVGGPDVDLVAQMEVLRRGRRVARDSRAPFVRRVPRGRGRLSVRVRLRDGRVVRLRPAAR